MANQALSLFWKARLAQAILIFIGGIFILPILYAFCFWPLYMAINANTLSFIINPEALMMAYPKNVTTATVIAIILCLRSFTWGELSWRFTLITGLCVAVLVEGVSRIVGYYFTFTGFGNEPFILWTIGWLCAVGLYQIIIMICGFNHRYVPAQRGQIIMCLWACLIFSCFSLTFTTLVTNFIDNSLPLLFTVLDLSNPSPTGILAAIILTVTMSAKLRRTRFVSMGFIWFMCLITYSLCALLDFARFDQTPWYQIASTQIIIALLVALFANITLRHLGLAGPHTRWVYQLDFHHKSKRFKIPFYTLIILALCGSVIAQFFYLTIIAIQTTIPPVAFWLENFRPAAIMGLVLFALPTTLYLTLKQRLTFNALILIPLSITIITALFLIILGQASLSGDIITVILSLATLYIFMSLISWRILLIVWRKYRIAHEIL